MADVFHSQSDGLGHALLGMGPLTLREGPSSEFHFSTGAVQIIADYYPS